MAHLKAKMPDVLIVSINLDKLIMPGLDRKWELDFMETMLQQDVENKILLISGDERNRPLLGDDFVSILIKFPPYVKNKGNHRKHDGHHVRASPRFS